MNTTLIAISPLLTGWLLDLMFGDPARLPHPIVWFGKLIAFGEHRLNKGAHRKLKGALLAIALITFVFATTWFLRRWLFTLSFLSPFPAPPTGGELATPTLNSLPLQGESEGAHFSLFNFHFSIFNYHFSSFPFPFSFFFDALIIFYCLAGTTLIREVRAVFLALDRSLDEGRRQVARIVGRDTSELSAQEVRTAALETLAENLSDGVIAPLFWFALLGTPGMLAYKMVNTLDSMIGYKTERYKDFGCWAAHIDDVANYIPARLTALLMVLGYQVMRLSGCKEAQNLKTSKPHNLITSKPHNLKTSKPHNLITFIWQNGRNHASPNSGYPEAALAAILDCRFGGPHYYFGQLFPKPYIGTNDRSLTTEDMKKAVRINRTAEVIMVILVTVILATLGNLLG